ncbi:hypothetical protein D3C87_88550 [compost metagenome]
MRICSLFVSVLFMLGLQTVNAQEAPPFKGEAEAGAVVVSGNTKSESYAAKAKATYTHEANVYSLFGHYLETAANGIPSAKNWDLGVRYERALSEHFSIYVGQKSESDTFAGYVQRDSSDIGLKYFIIKHDDRNWFTEAGYRYSKTLGVSGDDSYDNFGRFYTEYNQAFDKTLSFRYWAEYLPNFTEHDAYLANTEASLNVMLNSIFSLKFAYLLQYQNVAPATGEYTDTTTMMTLVAKF